MRFILKILKDFPAYLWSGWGSLASIFLFLALWDLGNQLYGNLHTPEQFGQPADLICQHFIGQKIYNLTNHFKT
ncbi:hypothetical protein [Aliarcobacter butzleri]|uniref:hypothetical protein n=1 Tax=Aliarcobacter butzleri TaxID=28197 RepID=UPI0021B198DD|nr:hypothetical protein [Aliarcobacter butzleri]MCT7609212.1 hypothetical protein [Aliarcobacter butzleri]